MSGCMYETILIPSRTRADHVLTCIGLPYRELGDYMFCAILCKMAKSEEFGKVLACPVIQGEARKALAGLIKSQDLQRFRHLELPRIDLHTAADQRSPVQIYDILQEAHGIGCAFEALEREVRGAYCLKDLTVASSPSIQYSASADGGIAHRMSSNLGLNNVYSILSHFNSGERFFCLHSLFYPIVISLALIRVMRLSLFFGSVFSKVKELSNIISLTCTSTENHGDSSRARHKGNRISADVPYGRIYPRSTESLVPLIPSKQRWVLRMFIYQAFLS